MSDEELASIYPDDYYSYKNNGKSRSIIMALFEATNNRHSYRPTFRNLLEVGSGAGHFLAKIRDRGNVVGLERSQAAAEAARARGLDVRVGDVTDAGAFAAAAFDYIYSNHAMEHIGDPERALGAMRHWLADEGSLFIAVPNAGGVVPRIFGRNWYHLNPPLHVTNFTAKGLSQLLQRTGFRINRIEYHSESVSIPMSIYIALGGRVDRLSFLGKALIGVAAIALGPIVALLDRCELGDCIEVHCTLVPKSP